MPSGFKRLQNSTIDLLNQLKKHNQLIKYELINPNIKNIEERNNLYKQLYEVGLNPTNLQTQNSGTKTEQIIFPGAIIYYKGKGVPQDYKKALKWYTLSAEQGNKVAQYNLGVMYSFGLGVVPDYKTALKWYNLSSEQGNALAQYNL